MQLYVDQTFRSLLFSLGISLYFDAQIDFWHHHVSPNSYSHFSFKVEVAKFWVHLRGNLGPPPRQRRNNFSNDLAHLISSQHTQIAQPYELHQTNISHDLISSEISVEISQ